MGEASQTTAKQHPVKAGHHTLDILLEFGDKLLHGVSPWFSVADLIHPTTYIIRGTPNTVCGLPLCGAGPRPAAASQAAPARAFWCQRGSWQGHPPARRPARAASAAAGVGFPLRPACGSAPLVR